MTQFLAKQTQNQLVKARKDSKEAILDELDAEQRERFEYIGILLGDLEGFNQNQGKFLHAMAVMGSLPEAARIAGIGITIVYTWLKDNDFREAYDIAKSIATDYMEYEAFKLATGRILRPVVSMGQVVTYERVYDTKLLHAILKAKKPNEYGNRVDITSGGQSLVKFIDREAYDAV